MRRPLVIAGLVGLLGLVVFTFLGPLVYRVNPYTTHLRLALGAPSPLDLLGTNNLGRDELARLMLGGQTSLEVGFAAAAGALVVGVLFGLIAGYQGGLVDAVMMRFVDIMRAIPALFLLIFFDAVFRPTPYLLVGLIILVSWNGASRLVRAEVLSLKTRPFVESAVAIGAGRGRIMVRYLLPNVLGTVMVAATFMVADAILTVAALSFLGLGLPPPAPNWGSMLSSSMSYLTQGAWWLVYPPGLAILVAVMSVNFLGDGVRELLDPRTGGTPHAR